MNDLLERLQGAVGDAYRIERELGGGGMSRVFLATESSLNRQVVIKLLAPELTSEVSTARFKREMEVTALLQHPHILPVLAAGARDGLLYYVMPYVAGESLRHRLARDGRFPVADVVRILSELAGALAYANGRGVVHRDIKPENILLSDGHAVLADFGIAAALAGGRDDAATGGARLTEVGMSMGTPGYMSPEQAAGDPNVDARADIYALAVVGYEMLAGAPPFTGPTLAVMTAHLTTAPKPIDAARPETPPGLAQALHRALAKKPEDRFQTAQEFADSLGVSFTGERPALRLGRRSLLVGGLAALVLVAGGLFAWQRTRVEPGLDDNLVAIAPFDVLDPSLEVWKEGMVDVLAANLDGAGPLRTVPPTVVLRRWKDGRVDRESAGEFGRSTGARLAVFGRLMPSGRDSLRLNATVYDAGSGRTLEDIELRDEAARVDRLSDSLTIRILRGLNQTRAIGAVRQSAIGSSSFPAIKAFLQGEQHYRRSDWDSAAFYYQRAVALDSNFAPALRHLSNALGWQIAAYGGNQNLSGYEHALRAGRFNRGLAPRESLLTVSDSLFAALMLAGQRTPMAERVALVQRLLGTLDVTTRQFPEDPESWFKLGDARYHFYQFVASAENLGRAREAFDRSIALDSAFAPSFIHVADIASKHGDEEGLRRYLRAYLAQQPIDMHADALRLVDRMLDPERARTTDLEAEMRKVTPVASGVAFQNVIHLPDSAETQVEMAKALRATADRPGLPPEFRRQAELGYVGMLHYRGHVREALRQAPATAFWVPAEAAMFGVIPADSARRMFAGWLARPKEVPGRLSISAAWFAQQGDTASLREVLRLAEAGGNPIGLPPWALRGYLALAQRDTAQAMRLLTVPDTTCLGWCAMVRLPLAEIHLAQGRHADAAALLEQDFLQTSNVRMLWSLARGRANEALGRKEKAVDAYAYVASMWANADPELQPYVKEARDGLRRLSTDPGVNR